MPTPLLLRCTSATGRGHRHCLERRALPVASMRHFYGSMLSEILRQIWHSRRLAQCQVSCPSATPSPPSFLSPAVDWLLAMIPSLAPSSSGRRVREAIAMIPPPAFQFWNPIRRARSGRSRPWWPSNAGFWSAWKMLVGDAWAAGKKKDWPMMTRENNRSKRNNNKQ